MKFVITTTQSQPEPGPGLLEFATATGFEFIPRRRRGLAELAREQGARGVIVWEPGGPVLYIDGEKLFFIPAWPRAALPPIAKRDRKIC